MCVKKLGADHPQTFIAGTLASLPVRQVGRGIALLRVPPSGNPEQALPLFQQAAVGYRETALRPPIRRPDRRRPDATATSG